MNGSLAKAQREITLNFFRQRNIVRTIHLVLKEREELHAGEVGHAFCEAGWALVTDVHQIVCVLPPVAFNRNHRRELRNIQTLHSKERKR